MVRTAQRDINTKQTPSNREVFADLHCHTNLDPVDGVHAGARGIVNYSYQQALAAAAKAGITVLSFTHHQKLICTKKMITDAKRCGIHLLPGFEAVIEGHDVVLINPTTDAIHTFDQLAAERKKNPNLFVLAPHPFYPSSHSLGFALLRHVELFDAIEFCHFYTSWWNVFNWIAICVAHTHKKTLIGTSDSHHLQTFGLTKTRIKFYSASNYLVSYSKKTRVNTISNSQTSPELFVALRTPNSCQVITQPISFSYLWRVLSSIARMSGFFNKSSQN